MKTYILSLIIFALVFTSCEKTISTIDLEKKDPKLVLHGFLSPGEDIVTNLTLSKSSLDGDNVLSIENALIEIFDGENQLHILTHDTIGFFIATENNLEPSKEYTIKASAPNFPEVSCQFSIPSNVEISSIDTTVRNYAYDVTSPMIISDGGEESQQLKSYSFHVKFEDSANDENFYVIKMYRNAMYYSYNEYYEVVDSFFAKRYINISSEDISAELGIHDSWIETKYDDKVYGSNGICFTDKFFSGKDKTFSFDLNDYFYFSDDKEKVTFYMELLSISKDYYTFLKSYALYDDTQYDPFAQKVNVFNNVEGGFGIIGTYSQSVDSIVFEMNGY